MLVGEVADDLETLLREKAAALDVEVKHLAIKPDHVRFFVEAPPDLSPAKLAHQFKGYSSLASFGIAIGTSEAVCRASGVGLTTWGPPGMFRTRR